MLYIYQFLVNLFLNSNRYVQCAMPSSSCQEPGVKLCVKDSISIKGFRSNIPKLISDLQRDLYKNLFLKIKKANQMSNSLLLEKLSLTPINVLFAASSAKTSIVDLSMDSSTLGDCLALMKKHRIHQVPVFKIANDGVKCYKGVINLVDCLSKLVLLYVADALPHHNIQGYGRGHCR